MLRFEVIQAVVNLFTDATYLEIGVNQGVTFHQVRAPHQVAVDPRFLFDVERALKENPHCRYYEITSDKFFRLAGEQALFDVIFLDGLHTFEQTLRDLLNSLDHLNDDGVIIIDDVHPVSYSSSLRNEAEALMVKRLVSHESDGAWMGDVYRLVFFIETFLLNCSYAAVQENNCHQLILWRERRDGGAASDRTMESIMRLGFSDVLTLRNAYRAKPLAEILNAIKNARLRPSKTNNAAPFAALEEKARNFTALPLRILRPTTWANIDRTDIPVVISGPLAGGETCVLVSLVDWQNRALSSDQIISRSRLIALSTNSAYAQFAELCNLAGHYVIVVVDQSGTTVGGCEVNLSIPQQPSPTTARSGATPLSEGVVYPVRMCRCRYSNWHTGDDLPFEPVPREDFLGGAAESELALTIIAPDERLEGAASLNMALSVGRDFPEFETLVRTSNWSSGTTYVASFRDGTIDVKNGVVLFDQERKAWADSCIATVLRKDGVNLSPALVPVDGQLAWIRGEQKIEHIDLPRPAVMLCHWACLMNYGHWMLNSLLSVYMVIDELKSGQLALLSPPLPARHRQEVLQMGVPEDAVIETSAQYIRLNRLLYPSPLSTRANIQPSTYCLEFFDYVKARFAKKFDYTPPEHIFITRKGYPTSRQMLNEDELIGCMTELGLTCVSPHELSFGEQIYAMSNAKLIVGQLGAALWNLPFAPKGGKVVEICTNNYTTNEYFYISHLMQHDFVRVMVTPEDEGDSFKFFAPIDELRKIVNALKD
ncbi:MAG: glycosyltransferase 61 family protein [Steroidobacteraceae bacterium]